MANRIQLGVPTEYAYTLPQLRHEFARRHLPAGVDTLLDFGCGNGANTVLFAADAKAVVGVDVVPAHIRTAAGHAAEQGLHNLTYAIYDGQRLPFADAAFDHVVSFEVVEHTADDLAALREIRRVMRSGAVLTMSVPNKWYLMETHGFDLPPRSLRWNRVPLMSWLPTPIHERYAKARIYTRRRILGLLDQAGFQVLEHRYLMPPFDLVRREPARRALQATFARIEASPLRVLGVSHVIAARKR